MGDLTVSLVGQTSRIGSRSREDRSLNDAVREWLENYTQGVWRGHDEVS